MTAKFSPEFIYDSLRIVSDAAYEAFPEDRLDGGTCGCASVILSGRGKLAKYLVENKFAMKTEKGIWLSIPTRIASQNIDVYERCAEAMRDCLTSFGVESRVHSWVD